MTPKLSTYRQLFALLRPYPALISTFLITSLLSTLTEGLGLGFILPLLDQSLIASDFLRSIPLLGTISPLLAGFTLIERVRLAAIGLALLFLLRSLFSIATQLVGKRLQINVESEIEEQIFQQLHAVQLVFIHRQKMGELITLLTFHIRQCGYLIQSVTNGVGNLFTLLIYTLLACFVSWQLTIATILLLAILFLIAKQGFSNRIRVAGMAETDIRWQQRTMTIESLTGLKLIHLFAQEQWSLQRLMTTIDAARAAAYNSTKLVTLSKHFLMLLAVITISGLLFAGTFLFPTQLEMWLGRMVLFLVIAFRLLNPLMMLNWMNSQVTNLAPALDGVLAFLRRDDKPYLQNGTRQSTNLQEGIQFAGVTFHYESAEPPVLTDVSFHIPKGKMTAVVGPSGAGKSSLVNLLARLYDCDAGQIMIDGVDLRDFDINDWRAQIAVVSQETFIFHDTVRANLQFARPSATEAEIVAAAQLAQAHEFIMALPEQYETILGDRGVRLSGGQQQRLTIARAVLAAPQLLIFDEATSALDSETEHALQQAIERYGRTRTMLVIAHRLSTIRNADTIVVLQGGRVVEQGTHATLLAQQGHYWRLVQAQQEPTVAPHVNLTGKLEEQSVLGAHTLLDEVPGGKYQREPNYG